MRLVLLRNFFNEVLAGKPDDISAMFGALNPLATLAFIENFSVKLYVAPMLPETPEKVLL